MSSRTCYAVVTADDLIVRFGWAFRCRVPRTSITAVAADSERVRAWGAHGWQHVWLVNRTSRDLTRIDIVPMARGRVLVFPMRIRALRLGIDNPDGLRAALRGRSSPR